jgi:hypothetical protein
MPIIKLALLDNNKNIILDAFRVFFRFHLNTIPDSIMKNKG